MFGELEGTRLHAVLIVACGLCFSMFGYDQGVVGGFINNPVFLSTIGNPNPTIQGLVVSIYDIGCMMGCGITAIYGLQLGRPRCVLIGCIIVIAGAIGQIANYHLAQMIVFRVLTGTGTGMISSTVPVWLSETSSARTRGRNIAMQFAVVLSGNVTAYWVNYGMSFVHSSAAFRFPLALQIPYVLIAGLIVMKLPETPRVLYYKGREREGDHELCRLRGYRGIITENATILSEKERIVQSIEFERANTSDEPIWRVLFWDNSHIRNSRRLFIVSTLQALQQLGGCNVIAYYQTTLFRTSVGLSEDTAKLVAGFSALCYFAGTLPPIYLVEKIGRRKLLIWGAAGCGLSMLVFTVLLATATGTQAGGWAAASMIFVFEFTVGSSWVSGVWIYSPEISPLRWRHLDNSLAIMSQWAFTFLTVMMAPTAIANTGYKIYILFTIITFLQIPFVYFLCPETAGKSLEELDLMFAKCEALEAEHSGNMSITDGYNLSVDQMSPEKKA
ncbi:general substrate transporter [Lipomyces kononenkoae]